MVRGKLLNTVGSIIYIEQISLRYYEISNLSGAYTEHHLIQEATQLTTAHRFDQFCLSNRTTCYLKGEICQNLSSGRPLLFITFGRFPCYGCGMIAQCVHVYVLKKEERDSGADIVSKFQRTLYHTRTRSSFGIHKKFQTKAYSEPFSLLTFFLGIFPSNFLREIFVCSSPCRSGLSP